ncbi:MAG: methyltransferase domain-containing protein [Anaerolineae bacterium]|jgi:ubiquinone/menaquinone biosynthesis C-methylase UbiE|nr:methyltransferase domain-containing protein [Anaerolineae bacterium]
MTDEETKTLTTQRFNRFAERYVSAGQLGAAPELQRLVELAKPQPTDRVLDVATGGGHTALTFAHHSGRVVATDLALGMLEAARTHLTTKGAAAVEYLACDAEHLPFPDESFDIVACRIAQHHFPDPFKFVMEANRVLRPGGRLVMQDQMTPEDERAARYLDSFERLRDPSHVRVYSALEWRGMYLDVGMTVEHIEEARHRTTLQVWAERQDCSPEVIERLHILLAQAPEAARAWVRPDAPGSPAATFDHVYILICGTKPGA